jgi:hypothetical protein
MNPELKNTFNPHLYLDPVYAGNIEVSFKIRLGKDVVATTMRSALRATLIWWGPVFSLKMVLECAGSKAIGLPL